MTNIFNFFHFTEYDIRIKMLENWRDKMNKVLMAYVGNQ